MIYRTSLLLSLLLLLAACATSPTGRSQLILLPDSQMNELGKQSFAELKTNSQTINNANTDYVRCISQRLLKTIGENPSDWEVQVFADDSPNAFALPGNKIGVHTGMINLAGRDELAAVMGHEIAHVKARHGAERLSMNMGVQSLSQLLSAGLSGSEYQGIATQALAIGSNVGVLLPYSRKHESEADAMGVVMMAQAGFNPKAGVTLWQKMAKLGQSSPEFLSTHPSSSSRIKAIEEQLPNVLPIYKQQHLASSVCAKP